MNSAVIWIIVGTLAFAVAATGLMRRYALRRNLLDVPNQRSSHSSPTPRGGGAAIVLVFFAALLALALVNPLNERVLGALLAGGGTVALVGLLDDHWSLPASVRFGVHVATAILVVTLLGGIPERVLGSWGLHGVWIGDAMAVVALVWISNLFNFMDGIDGIAGTEAVFLAVAGAWLNWYKNGDFALTAAALCLAAASLGFLVWNWPPARIFMGDVGSGFLGFTLAVLGLATSQRSTVPVEVWAILGGVFLVDATVTLLRRMLRGERWFEAHRTHAYQRLARRWKAHVGVTVGVIAIDVFWLLPWAWLATRMPAYASPCMAAALIPLILLALVFGAGSRE